MSTTQTLRRIGSLLAQYDMDVATFATAIEDALNREGPPHRAARVLPPLDLDDAEIRRAVEAIDAGSFQINAATNVAETVASSESVSAAASTLRLTEEQLRSAVQGDEILGVTVDGVLRIPTWQYSDDVPPKLLPNLGVVIASAMARGIGPDTLAGFMRTPQPSLGAITPFTPRSWLAAGHDPEKVAVALTWMRVR